MLSLTTATTVVGVDTVTIVLDNVRLTDGVPVAGAPTDEAVKPAVAVKAVPAIVAVATARSAPLVVAVVGESFTATEPLASLNADAGLKVPRPSMVENFTTWPATGLPVASFTVTFTSAGADVVTDVLDSNIESDGVPTGGTLVADT